MQPEQDIALSNSSASRLISDQTWGKERFQWLAAVRADADLSDRACRIAHVLVLDIANHVTATCTASYDRIREFTGHSSKTTSRGIKELENGGWIDRRAGSNRGSASEYRFFRRAKVVPLYPSQDPKKRGSNLTGKGVKSHPEKGVKSDPLEVERGSNLSRKGVKSDQPYNNAKPYFNHRGAQAAPKLSENPQVHRTAERAVAAFRGGRRDELFEVRPWIRDHILAAGMLTDAEVIEAGWSQAENGDRADV
ncbi:hypothetical protein [Marinovum sp.]|uniref:hypothetical protein n=1 Tax=Marinovum sp. TaxID=2024839 RepID=UPI002B2756EF|nr:hypothetical protein [Marinovum sp.]